jgi:valine--pyruvate aminotransferase
VLTQEELARLSELAVANQIPLIIDNAYGTPFPNIIFTDARPIWNDNTIVCMSLSKLGLPAVRTGIVIASPEIVRMISHVNAVMSLAPGSLGAAIATDLIRSKRILNLCRENITPFYLRKGQRAIEQLAAELEDVDFHIHKPEGAFFLWLWFRNLPITCAELYERLKARGVLIIPGHHFFPGLDEPWKHKHECIRLNYAADEEVVRRGIDIIADEVKRAYAE